MEQPSASEVFPQARTSVAGSWALSRALCRDQQSAVKTIDGRSRYPAAQCSRAALLASYGSCSFALAFPWNSANAGAGSSTDMWVLSSRANVVGSWGTDPQDWHRPLTSTRTMAASSCRDVAKRGRPTVDESCEEHSFIFAVATTRAARAKEPWRVAAVPGHHMAFEGFCVLKVDACTNPRSRTACITGIP